jgi:ABC-type dipeptide/oligopeptide/nickel transport system permease component
MQSLRWKLAGHALALLATVLLGGLLSATLVRLAPGFDTDERELDPHLNAQSVQALRDARRQDHNLLRFYFSYMKRAAHGELGTSLALGQPVRTLLCDRAPKSSVEGLFASAHHHRESERPG